MTYFSSAHRRHCAATLIGSVESISSWREYSTLTVVGDSAGALLPSLISAMVVIILMETMHGLVEKREGGG